MKVLLDACIDRTLARYITGHEVRTAHQMGWSDVRKGALLTLAVTSGFDAFVTVDRSISFQQNLSRYQIALVLMRARTNRRVDLIPVVPNLLAALPLAPKGEVRLVTA